MRSDGVFVAYQSAISSAAILTAAHRRLMAPMPTTRNEYSPIHLRAHVHHAMPSLSLNGAEADGDKPPWDSAFARALTHCKHAWAHTGLQIIPKLTDDIQCFVIHHLPMQSVVDEGGRGGLGRVGVVQQYPPVPATHPLP